MMTRLRACLPAPAAAGGKPETLAVLDIGTSRIACALASCGSRPLVLAAETVTGFGIRRGEVVDLERAAEALRATLTAVEEKASVRIRSLLCAFSGDIRLTQVCGSLPLRGDRRAVTETDVRRLRRSLLPDGPGRRVVYRFDGPYGVGALAGIEQPIGLCGATLAMNSSFLTVSRERFENLLRTLRAAEIEVEAFLPDPLAASRGVLTAEERALGVVLLDLGAGGFRAAFWEGGRLRQVSRTASDSPAAPLPCPAAPGGMECCALDLARRFRIAPAVARSLLQQHGSVAPASAADSVFELPALDRLSTVRISARELSAALEESLVPQLRNLRDGLSACQPAHAGGIVICGQGARLPGLPELVARHFGGAPVRLGVPGWELAEGLALPEELTGPGGATLNGLIQYGLEQRLRLPSPRFLNWKEWLQWNWRRVAAVL